MLNTHPDTIRPDHGAGFYIPTGPSFPLESPDIARRMATVILRQAGEGQSTELRHFRDAPETKDLSPDAIALHIGAASRLADPMVIRQDAEGYRPPREAGEVYGIPEMTEGTDEELLAIAEQTCGQLVTDDDIVGMLLRQGLRPSAISRIWDRLTAKLAAGVAAIDKPSIGHIAARAALASRKVVG